MDKNMLLRLAMCFLLIFAGSTMAMKAQMILLPQGQDAAHAWAAKAVYSTAYDASDPSDDANGHAWYDTDFDDSGWQIVKGAIGYNYPGGWNAENGSYWVRREFTLDAVPKGNGKMWILHDDGVRVYLNGTLIFENGGCGSQEFVFDGSLFKTGKNVFSVCVANSGGGDAYLDFSVSYDPNVILSAWKNGSGLQWPAKVIFNLDYNASDPADDASGLAWYEGGYDDSSWQSVKGAVGGGWPCHWPEEYRTCWVRRTFTFDASSVSARDVLLYVWHDDGVRIYLNGTQIYTDGGCAEREIVIDHSLLKEGENILAGYVFDGGGARYLDFGLYYSKQFSLDGVRYTITSQNTVEVAPSDNYSGEIVVPETIQFDGKTYTVTGVGDNAFNGRAITRVALPSTIQYFGSSSFRSTNLTSLTIPRDVTSMGQEPFWDNDKRMMQSFSVEEGNTTYAAHDGVLYNVAAGSLVRFPVARTGSYTLPSEVNGVAITSLDAFSMQSNSLSRLTLPSSITSLHYFALGWGSLDSLVCENSVPANLEDECFNSLTDRTMLVVPARCEDVYRNAWYWNEFKTVEEASVDMTLLDEEIVSAQEVLALFEEGSSCYETLFAAIEKAKDRSQIKTWNQMKAATKALEDIKISVQTPVGHIDLNKTSLQVAQGHSKTLNVLYTPQLIRDYTVTWTSSDPSVVSVDQDGVVTGQKKGTATITATTTDGGKTATCQVDCREAVYPTSAPYEFNYNMRDYDENSMSVPNQLTANLAEYDLQLYDAAPTFTKDHLTISNSTKGYINKWESESLESGQYFRMQQQDDMTIIVKVGSPQTEIHQMGLSTWQTSAQFADLKWVDKDGNDLMIAENGLTGSWTQYGNGWSVHDGIFEQSNPYDSDVRYVYSVKSHAKDYTISMRATKTGGAEGFMPIYSYADDNNFYRWNLGGWENTRSVIQHIVNGETLDLYEFPFTPLESNRTYDVKIKVDGGVAYFYIDDVLQGSVPHDLNYAPVGDLITNRNGYDYNYMLRVGQNNSFFLHTNNGNPNQRSLPLKSSSPQVFAVRANSTTGQLTYNNLTTGEQQICNIDGWGGYDNTVFNFFHDREGGYFRGDVYWMYYSKECLTDTQLQEVADYNEVIDLTDLNNEIATAESLLATYEQDKPWHAALSEAIDAARQAEPHTAKQLQAAISALKEVELVTSTKIQSLELLYEGNVLRLDEELRIGLKYYPEKVRDNTILWESSDEDVATVSDGVVVAKAVGNVTITARGDNNIVRVVNIRCIDPIPYPQSLPTGLHYLGDVDGDGKLTLTDVAIMAQVIRQEGPMPQDNTIFDVNEDQKLDVSDLVHLIQILNGKKEKKEIFISESINIDNEGGSFD